MALAAFPPLMWTYLADTLPPTLRGRTMMICAAVGGCGAIFAPMLSNLFSTVPVLGLDGWRTTLGFGGLGGILVAATTAVLPESPRWLEAMGRSDSARAACDRFVDSPRLFAAASTKSASTPIPPRRSPPATEGDFRWRLALYLILQLLQPLAVIGFIALSGVVLTMKGFSVRQSLGFTAVQGLGSPIGAVLASFVVDRISRPALFIGCSLVLAALGIAFALAHTSSVAIIAGLGFLLVGTVYAAVLSIYGPEMFPTSRRGVAAGSGYGANRVGAALVPFALLPLLFVAGPLNMFLLIAATLAVSAALVAVAGPRHTAGSELN
jgi:putative MFS transporter